MPSCCENPTRQRGRKALGTKVQSSANAAAWCQTAHCIPNCIPTATPILTASPLHPSLHPHCIATASPLHPYSIPHCIPIASLTASPLHPPPHPHRPEPAPAVCAGEGKPGSLPSGSSCRLHECSFSSLVSD